MAKQKSNKYAKPAKTHDERSKVEKETKPQFTKIWPVLIALFITGLCFTSSINNEFVSWDDDRNIYENPDVLNFDMKHFGKSTKTIFSSHVIGNYNPLPIWTFALEKNYIGIDKPHQWHVHNILLHLSCVFFAYLLAVQLGLSWQGALILALLFGIHPLRSESVSWVTERKDVLFGLFYLMALWQYVKYKKDSNNIRWLWITIAFILSLFSKIQAVSLPLSMLVIDYFMDSTWKWSNLWKKIPFFLLSLVFGLYGIMKLKEFGSISSATDSTDFSFIQRLFVGAFSFIIYIIKWIIPFRMVPMYPYPNHFPAYFYPTILVAPLAIWLLLRWHKQGKKNLVFGLTFFIVNIFFLLQILGAGQGYLADRFTYIAYYGLFFIAAYYFDKFISENPSRSTLLWGGAALYLMIMGVLTYNQGKIWKNSDTLWSHVIKYYPNTTLPWGNRANYFRDKKDYKRALSDYAQNLKLNDKQPQTYNSRGRLYFDVAGQSRDTLLLALSDYNKAISLSPQDGEFRVNRGATYARLGDINKAIEDFNEGIKLKPDHAVGYLNRSIMYNMTQQYDKAHADIDTYLKYNPTNANLWYEKGVVLFKMQKFEEALLAYQQAINIGGDNLGLYHYERAKFYDYLQRIPEAKSDLQTAIQLGYTNIDPGFKQKLGL
jgi:tetratricopeptide (TPR) repeat protein